MAFKEVGEHPQVVVRTDPLHIRCLSCGLRATDANEYPRWAYLRSQECRNPPAGRAAPGPAALFEIGEVASSGWSGLADLNAAAGGCIGPKTNDQERQGDPARGIPTPKATSWSQPGPLAHCPFPKRRRKGGEVPAGRGVPARRGVGLARGVLRPGRGQEAWECRKPGPPNEPGPFACSQKSQLTATQASL